MVAIVIAVFSLIWQVRIFTQVREREGAFCSFLTIIDQLAGAGHNIPSMGTRAGGAGTLLQLLQPTGDRHSDRLYISDSGCAGSRNT